MLVGVVGGGQLGRMLGLAGVPLGMRMRFLDPSPDAPAGDVGDLVVGPYDDPDGLKRLAHEAAVVTYEFENVPVAAAREVARHALVLPSPEALEAAQDRLAEKTLFERVGIAVAPFRAVDSERQLRAALEEVGPPAVVKTRRLGYDGKGQAPVGDQGDVTAAWRAVGERPCIVERRIDFEREMSVLAVRSRGGETAIYPLVENSHRGGILRESVAPAPDVTTELRDRAEEHARALLDDLDYVGVLAIELFQAGGELLAGEFAPRVHNSGHWTIEGAETSQFENHLRAIAGLPLGSTEARGVSTMINLLGKLPDADTAARILAVPGAHLHLYGKGPRPDRKLGHVTVVAADRDALRERVRRLGDLGD
jgi:5-(carboxyamino)imidazole ribonucleotide synthase